MKKAIEIRNLSFAYEGVSEQLKNVNLSIKEGEVVVLTGPSGGGKSTLTRVINGLVPYFYEGELSGEVYLLGKNLAELPSWERGRFVIINISYNIIIKNRKTNYRRTKT